MSKALFRANWLAFIQAVFHAGLVATGDDNFTAEDAEIAEFIIFSASSAFSAVTLRAGLRVRCRTTSCL